MDALGARGRILAGTVGCPSIIQRDFWRRSRWKFLAICFRLRPGTRNPSRNHVVSSIPQGTAKCSPARPGSFPGAAMFALEEQGVALRRVPSRLRKGRNDSQASNSPPVSDSGRSAIHARNPIAFHQTLSCDSRKRHLAELRREQHVLCVRAPPGSTAEGQTRLDRGSPTLSEPSKRPPWGSTSAQTCWWCHTWGRSQGTVRGGPTSFVSCRRRNECQRGDTLGGPVP